MHALRWLFGLSMPVGRVAYAMAGFGLMALKYAIDAAVIHTLVGRAWMPWDYLNPFLTSRSEIVPHEQSALLWWLAGATLPFLWIGVALTVRRARDAGLRPEIGLLFFLPFVNYLLMILLCCLPSRNPQPPSPYAAGAPLAPAEPTPAPLMLSGALLGTAVGASFAMLTVLFSVYVLGEYGRALFLGSPFVVGAAAAYVVRRRGGASMGYSQAAAQLAIAVSGGLLLLFALEGAICLIMAWPLAIPMAAIGAWIGHQVAGWRPGSAAGATVSPLWILALAWPLLGMADAAVHSPPPLHAVVTSLIIDAPPERVWPNVIGFSELPPPSDWVFLAGVSYPMRARIEGAGVGAVRYCEFSTGPFVEPITVWDPPHRLAFDVAAQPPALHELSPYEIEAPHLDGFLQSRRGEFLLRALPDGRTELIGTTWYQVHIGPQPYWQLFSDAFIHRIHRRVLVHIQTLSEEGGVERRMAG